MQVHTVRFSNADLVKYPFLQETADYVKRLDFKIEDITNPELGGILQRARERVEEAISRVAVSRNPRNPEVEILSFPVAIMLVIASGNSYLKKRYALAEAKSVYEDLKQESTDRLILLGHVFGWDLVRNTESNIAYELRLAFQDYLRNIAQLRSGPWRLVNRVLSNGYVYLNRSEAARLMQEEAKNLFEERLGNELPSGLPEEIVKMTGEFVSMVAERGGRNEAESFPNVVIQEAFPPCIKALYESFESGHHLSHIGRFTLTSFLITVGMPSENVVELFKGFSDFSERMTRYQVEHIAGERGSRTQYRPPRCDTLRTHGVCSNSDSTCARIRNPTHYYRAKTRDKSVKPSKQE